MSARPTSNRREFLQGRAATDALAAAVDSIRPAAPVRAEAPESAAGDSQRYLVQYSRPAMACQFAIFLNAGQYSQAAEAALAALDLVEQIEDQLTVYRDASEVMRINRLAGASAVGVEPGLYDLLAKAVKLSHDTGGAFDITAGALVKAWGFYRRAGSIPTEADLRAALENVGSQHLVLDDEHRTIRFLRPGIELNLGAIGKGYALDRTGAELVAAGVHDFLFHGGQSSVVARGSAGGREAAGWTVGLVDPLRQERRLAEIYLRNRALATSGASHQFFRHEGKRYGHILDPRSGWPAQGVFSSTVIAPTAAEADALSTAFYTLGVDAAQAYCDEHPEIGMILLHPGKGASSVEIATVGLGKEDWRLL
jgi:thiamine biosynthesis lipoprotein